MPAGLPVLINDFSGGWNALDDPLKLPPDQSQLLLNVRPGGGLDVGASPAALSVRAGDVNLSTSVITRPVHLAPYNTGATVIVGGNDGAVYSVDSGTGVVTNIRAAVGILGSFMFAEGAPSGGQGPLYGLVPLNVAPFVEARQWTGAGALAAWTASAGTLPLARQLLWVQNRMWAFGRGGTSPAGLSDVAWSELGDPRNWPAANLTKLDPDDGDELITAAAFGATIVAFKQRKAWRIYDLDTSANTALAYGTGAARFAVTTPIGIVFDDPDQGLMVTDGVNIKRLPNGERAGIIGSNGSENFRGATWTGQPVAFGGSIFFPVLEGAGFGFTELIYEYDLKTSTWARHDGGSLITVVDAGTGVSQDRMYIASSLVAGKVIKFMQAAAIPRHADASTLAPTYTSPWFYEADPNVTKRLVALFVEGVGTFNVSIYRNFDDVNAVITRGPFTLPAGAKASELRLNDLGVGRAFMVKIVGTGTTAWSLSGLRAYFRQRGRG